MKKKRIKPRLQIKAKSIKTPGRASGETGVGGAVPRLAAKAAEVARKSREQADQLHRKADQVHTKAEEAHRRADDVEKRLRSKRVTRGSPVARPEQDIELAAEQSPPRQGKSFPIVGVGASAGGYEAFNELLRHLPKQNGMAFVLVQHLDPKQPSQLTELLRRGTELAVVEARDGVDVQPNQVYVIPAATSLTLAGGRLRLRPRRDTEIPPMPVDAFFRSLAQEQQERAIGIIMSGTGTDGTLGMEAIKGEGGITFAQHEHSAKYYGMPSSAIASGAVDFILSPDEIALELCRIASHPYLGGEHKERREKSIK